MGNKKKEYDPIGETLKLLKSYGLKYEQPFYRSPLFVQILAIAACACDGTTIYRVVDGFFNSMSSFTMITTVMLACILNMLPAYFGESVLKLKYYRQRMRDDDYFIYKTLLKGGVVVWLIVYVAVCITRYANADFVLNSYVQFQEESMKSGDFYIALTKYGKMALMTMFNAENLGSSVFVFIASMCSSISIEKREELLKTEFELKKKQIINRTKSEFDQYQNTADNTEKEKNYIEKQIKHYEELAEKQAKAKACESREDLMKARHDGDISRNVINSKVSLNMNDIKLDYEIVDVANDVANDDDLRGDY